ncbi:cell wall anchor protein [Methylobacterium sp. NMS12]|uniref:cell wall anchor protein n=1 Tax=Methylobacterium sp. NMS12 TaxID=3079766 RepID=UPI003F8836ED
MSVNTVSGSSLQRDLVGALRQARAANAARLDVGTAATAGQETGTQATADGTAPSTGTASTPTLSNDLMASLLQLQSDFSQMGLQNGVTAPAEAAANADDTSTTGAAAGQAAAGATPVQHHRGHHGHRPVSDADQSGAAAQTGTATDASASSASAASASTTAASDPATETAKAADSGSDLQSFLQQVTKAVTAYAAGGPLGIAAALTSSTKA